jgi:hypothetical protein
VNSVTPVDMMRAMVGRGDPQLDVGSELQGALLFRTFSNIPDCTPQFDGLSSECPERESSAEPECYQVPPVVTCLICNEMCCES